MQNAVEWYTKSASQGNSIAIYCLVMIYKEDH